MIAPFKAPLAALELLPEPQPPQEPVETGPRAEVERAPDDRVRHAVAARPPTRAAKIVDWTAPDASIAGAPESPCCTPPETAVIVRGTGPWPYASCVKTTCVCPMRPGVSRSGPFSG